MGVASQIGMAKMIEDMRKKKQKSDVDLDRVDPDFDNIKEDTTQAVADLTNYDHYGD